MPRSFDSIAVRRAFFAGAALLAAAGCGLFDTRGANTGSGPSNFDPYVGARSPAVRLGLQHFKGCATYATGEPVGKGAADIPYPANCPRHPAQERVPATDTPQPMPLLTEADYFLGQIALTDELTDAHLDPKNPGAATGWITTQSLFKNLDWSGLGTTSDTTEPLEGSTPGIYARRVFFGNSAWQQDRADFFFVEVLDGANAVRAQQTYSRSDFLAENATAGHTKVFWTISNIGAPEFPGDVAIHPPTAAPPGAPPNGPVTSQTMVRMERAISTDPGKTFRIPAGVTGDGAIRVTWSALPDAPFYFPVRFVSSETLPADCFRDDGSRVACTFGVVPQATFSTPQNGTHYVPGEAFDVTVAARDGAGNLLHPPGNLPSWNDYFVGKANGLIYLNLFPLGVIGELDSVAGLALSGPLQDLRFYYDLGKPTFLLTADFMTSGFPDQGTSFLPFPTGAAAVGVLPGGRDAPIPTRYRFRVPDTAPAGTYSAVVKFHRQFLGERVTKATPFSFQIGQAEPTRTPGRVGNCQLCHRGVISLDNVRHGLPVSFVEGCKTCHNRDEPLGAKSVEIIHQLHMNSPKYPAAKTDCATCHLTRESVVRPSLAACGSCHPTAHGDEFFQMRIEPPMTAVSQPNKFSNCAQQCHGTTLPTAHQVPKQ